MIKISLLIAIICAVINIFSSLPPMSILLNAILTMLSTYLLLLLLKLIFVSIALSISHRYGIKNKDLEKSTEPKK